MKKLGFIYNRIFDVLACNKPIVTAYVEGISSIFKQGVFIYKSKKEFVNQIDEILKMKDSNKLNSRQLIVDFHTYNHRAAAINTVIKTKI